MLQIRSWIYVKTRHHDRVDLSVHARCLMREAWLTCVNKNISCTADSTKSLQGDSLPTPHRYVSMTIIMTVKFVATKTSVRTTQNHRVLVQLFCEPRRCAIHMQQAMGTSLLTDSLAILLTAATTEGSSTTIGTTWLMWSRIRNDEWGTMGTSHRTQE